MPRTSSRLVEKTGIRLRPDVIARSSTAPTVEEASTATTSGRGRITSRTIVSPNSMIEEMRARSSLSSTSSSTATSARARSLGLGDVRLEVGRVVPGRDEAREPDEQARHQPDRREADDRGHERRGEQRGAVRVADGPVLRDRLGGDEDHHDLEDGRDRDAERTEQARGLHADERRRDELADRARAGGPARGTPRGSRPDG